MAMFRAIRPLYPRFARQFADAPSVGTLYIELKRKFGHMGVVNHKEIGVWTLFDILKLVKSPKDLAWALQTMNLFYNFGIKMKHRELSTRLLAATMLARQDSEALELIKLYGRWLERPPDLNVVYAVMSKLLDDQKPKEVLSLAKHVREDWRFQLEPALYSLAIRAALQQEALDDALKLRWDAQGLSVRLEPKLQLQLLDACLLAAQVDESEAPADEVSRAEVNETYLAHLRNASLLATGLAQEGYVRAGASAASLCSVSWLLWHLSRLPEGTFEETWSGFQWSAMLEAACESFNTQVGHSAQLPKGLFELLEASDDAEAKRLIKLSRSCFGRFYPL